MEEIERRKQELLEQANSGAIPFEEAFRQVLALDDKRAELLLEEGLRRIADLGRQVRDEIKEFRNRMGQVIDEMADEELERRMKGTSGPQDDPDTSDQESVIPSKRILHFA